MLDELRIRNFAIIDDLHLHFKPGLNILTGETGAGKSIIIDAVGLLLGDRATADWVRAGSELAEIEANFRLPLEGNLVAELGAELEDQGLEDPDNPHWISLSREVRLSGRNISRINGRAVSLQILSKIAAHLIDVHGQGEHLGLLQPRTHLFLLDRYAGLSPLRLEIARQVGELRTVSAELQRLRQDARTMAQRVDLLSFQVEEIVSANLQTDELAILEAERRRLSNAETLRQLAQSTQAILDEGESEVPGAVDLVSEAVGRLEKLARIDPDMANTARESQGLLEELSELGRTLQDYAEQLESNPRRLREVEERLELIAGLKRKYGDTIEQVIAFGAQAQSELDTMGNWETRSAELEASEEALLHSIGESAARLSQQRRTAGDKLARQVEVELADLRMDRAQFGVAMDQNEREDGVYLPDGRRVACRNTGIDKVEFLISANPGEPLKPMVKVASGGETARLMLALKGVLAQAVATPTLIFDEIDQGIGGRVGAVVGRKLWRLTGAQRNESAQEASHQVLCITHLPQLAAFGDYHLTVLKQVLAENGVDRTRTQVTALDDDDRVEELMQMLGATTEAGRRSVMEMMEDVAKVKQADSAS